MMTRPHFYDRLNNIMSKCTITFAEDIDDETPDEWEARIRKKTASIRRSQESAIEEGELKYASVK